MESGKTVVTRDSSHQNLANLPESYTRTILSPYEGTRLGRQEIAGELLEDVPGVLWSYQMIDECRVERVPEGLVRVVVAVHPAMSVGTESNETGLIVVAQGRDGHSTIGNRSPEDEGRPPSE